MTTDPAQPVEPRLPLPQLSGWHFERLLRQHRESFSVAPGWRIGFDHQRKLWQVFHDAIDATYRLAVGNGAQDADVQFFPTFVAAWRWLQQRTETDIYKITVLSKCPKATA